MNEPPVKLLEVTDWIRKEIQALNLPYGGDGGRFIKEENIEFRPFRLDQDPNDDWLRECSPGIILSLVDTREVGRLNCEDDWAYTLSLQLFDRDMSTSPKREDYCYWFFWSQQLSRLFSQCDARGEIADLLWMGVPSMKWVEKVRYQRHRLALWDLPITATVRMSRLAASRSEGINGEET